MGKQKFGFTYKTRKYSPSGMPLEGYERRTYYGSLKSLTDLWSSKAEVRKSRAFHRFQKAHKNPRIVRRR